MIGLQKLWKMSFISSKKLGDIHLFVNFPLNFLGCNGCFGLFTKIIKKSGASFCCPFSNWFFCNNVLYLILHLWTRFQCHTFCPSQDIKQSVLLSSYLDNWWRHELFEFLLRQLMTLWTLRFIFDHSLKQWLTGRKRRKDRNTKNWISRERKELFRRWNKKDFS